MFLLLFLFFCVFSINSQLIFSIESGWDDGVLGEKIFKDKAINIYSPDFYLSDRVRINTNFMIGSSQKVLYLNYPFTFTNDAVNNNIKNTNSSGIVILKNQPSGVTAANLQSQTSIVPIAYFTLQSAPIGWILYTPADYFQQPVSITQISLYNNNIYFGRSCGPNIELNLGDGNVASELNKSGLFNVVLGNNSGHFKNDKLLSYNTIVGCMSGNLITGSFNSFFGDYHADRKILNPNYLNQDYYSNNDFSNYNNAFGFGNFNLTHSTSQGLKFLANKQNNVFGNLNFSSVWRGYRNCIFGNRILTTNVDNITQFNWIDSNIMIGNNILYEYGNNLITGLYGNIILVPNGDKAIYGGIDVSGAFAPLSDDNKSNQCNYAIMIGSCGLPFPYERSYKTFISNIYNSSLIQTGVSWNPSLKVESLSNLDSTSFPITVMINNADQLGQMELVPYRDFSYNDYDVKRAPGNVTNLDRVIQFLLDPSAMPVVGVALENSEEATKKGLLYTVDAYALINNNAGILAGNPLSSFVIYTSTKHPVPYAQATGKLNNNIISGITSEIKVAGYEHYYLIPLLVRACQIMNGKIETMRNGNIACGNLVAAMDPGQTVSLGNNNGNYIFLTSNIGDLMLQASGNADSNVNIVANKNIVVKSPSINSFYKDFISVLGVNSNGSLMTVANDSLPSLFSDIVALGSIDAKNYIRSPNISFGKNDGNYLRFMNSSDSDINFIVQAKKNGDSSLMLSAYNNINISGKFIRNVGQLFSLLGIDSNGNLTTIQEGDVILGNTEFKGSADITGWLRANSIKFGLDTGGNYIGFNNNLNQGDDISIIAKKTIGSNLNLASGNNINISGKLITKVGQLFSLLGVDSDGNLTTIQQGDVILRDTQLIGSLDITGWLTAKSIILGDEKGNYIGLNNNLNQGDQIMISSKKNSQSDIILSASNNINISGKNIIKVVEDSNYLLVDSGGNLVTGSGNNVFTTGGINVALVDGQSVSLGQINKNYIGFINNAGNLQIQSKGSATSDLLLSANRSIKITSSNITPSSIADYITLLGVDQTGTLKTIQSGYAFLGNTKVNGSINITGYLTAPEVILGDYAGNLIKFNNNVSDVSIYIQAGKSTASDLILKANQNIVIASSAIPAITTATPLYIGPGGKMIINQSSMKYKKNIVAIENISKDIEDIKPVSFQYINDNSKTHYGFIAEEINDIKSLKNTVIFNENNEVESIDYNSIFVIVFAYLLNNQKSLQEKYNKLHSEYYNLYKKLDFIKKQLEHKNNEIFDLNQKYNELKDLILLVYKNKTV